MKQINKELKISRLRISNITQRKIGILGGTGSGKTTTLKLLAKASDVPVYIFDPLNVIRIKGFSKILITKKSMHKGCETAKAIPHKEDNKIIFSFSNMLQKEIIVFIDAFFRCWNISDAIVMIDEIHEICPEKSTGGVYAFEVERAIRHWRNKNVGFVFTSQRAAMVRKNVMALTDYLILLRITWGTDLKAASELMNYTMTRQQSQLFLKKIQTAEFMNGMYFDFRQKTPTVWSNKNPTPRVEKNN